MMDLVSEFSLRDLNVIAASRGDRLAESDDF
jgi:hypothetical protein